MLHGLLHSRRRPRRLALGVIGRADCHVAKVRHAAELAHVESATAGPRKVDAPEPSHPAGGARAKAGPAMRSGRGPDHDIRTRAAVAACHAPCHAGRTALTCGDADSRPVMTIMTFPLPNFHARPTCSRPRDPRSAGPCLAACPPPAAPALRSRSRALGPSCPPGSQDSAAGRDWRGRRLRQAYRLKLDHQPGVTVPFTDRPAERVRFSVPKRGRWKSGRSCMSDARSCIPVHHLEA